MKTLDLSGAAKLLNISYSTASELASSGELPGTKVGAGWVFIEEDLIHWLRDKIKHDQEQRRMIYNGEIHERDFIPAVPPRRARNTRNSRRREPPVLPGYEEYKAHQAKKLTAVE